MSLWYSLLLLIAAVLTSVAQNDYCREGSYGNKCELTCPEQCRPLQTFPCDKETGRCAEGCNGGYYGDQCDKQCVCASGICFRANGECYGTGTTKANTTNRVGPTTEAPVRASDCEAVEGEWFIIAIILIILIIILIGLVVLMLLYRRWEMKQSSRTASGRNQRRCLGIVPSFPACFCGLDSGADIPENVPLNSANAPPLPENNPEAAADKLDEKQTQDRQGDRSPIESGESKEELKQRIRELEQELGESKEKRRQSIIKLEDEIEEKYVAEQNKILKNLGLPTNSTNHLIKTNELDPSMWLQCPHLKFDTERVNVKVAQVDENKVLWNIPDTRNPVDNSRRFQQFSGTTCTDPLVRTGFYQYFEAIFNIDLKRSFGEGEVVMQLGFCEEKDQDVNKFIQGNNNNFVLKVVGCKKHKNICLVCTQGGKTDHVQQSMMNNFPGSKIEVNIGVRLNKEMKRLAVYNFRLLKMLKKTHINIGERSWPMFGMCDQRKASINVDLQAGSDIKMWDEKKEILKKIG